MSKTNELRKLVVSQFKTLGSTPVYYEQADPDAMYPHIVVTFREDKNGLFRDDVMMDVDVYYKSTSSAAIEDLCDSIEDLFHMKNLPQTNILPTFYCEGRQDILEADHTVKRRLVRFQIQNYERT